MPNELLFFPENVNIKLKFDLTETINLLNQFENTKNLIENVYILIMTINNLRIEMLKVKKMHVNEMDYFEFQNVLLIIVLIFSKLEYPLANLLMIEDFISLCHEYDAEKSVILKYKVGFTIIFFFILFFYSF